MSQYRGVVFWCLFAASTVGCGGDVEHAPEDPGDAGEQRTQGEKGGSSAIGGEGGAFVGEGGDDAGEPPPRMDLHGAYECPDGRHRQVTAPACGDGLLTVAEFCDDGNVSSGDGCNSQCRVEPGWRCPYGELSCFPCGNCTLDEGEACDDGNQESGDGCSSRCEVEVGYTCLNAGESNGTVCVSTGICGDGERASLSEACDDGNQQSGDGCSNDCATELGWLCPHEAEACVLVTSLYPHCGDGEVQSEEGESCDDGSNDARDGGCSADCQVPSCGDGQVQPEYGEECDDGVNDGAYLSCRADCTPAPPSGTVDCTSSGPRCGDGRVEPGLETCDDGVNDGRFDHCTPACTNNREGFCGDGTTDVDYEECDDGNIESCDGCSSRCQKEVILP